MKHSPRSRNTPDVAEGNRKIHELERLTRLHAALSRIHRAIIHGVGRPELLLDICRALVMQGGFCMAWIGWNKPGSDMLVPVASWGKDADWSVRIDIPTRDRPSVCNDLMQEPATNLWHDALRQHGVRAAAYLPIRERGMVCGILMLCARERDVFGDKEIDLLVEAAANVSLALDNQLRDVEVRRAAEGAEHERLFSAALLESLPGILYFFDEQGRFLRWNRNFMTVSGYSAGEISAMRPADFFAGHDQILAIERINTVFRTGAADLEVDFLAKDGRSTPYYFTGRRVVIAGITGLVGMGVDLSERRRAEAAVRESAALSRGVLDSILAHVAVLDASGNILAVNDAWRQFAGENGMTADVLARIDVGANYLAVCRDLADGWTAQVTELHRGLKGVLDGELCKFQLEYSYHIPGGDRWFLLMATRMKTLKDVAVVAHFDITERREAEQQLHLSNRRFEMLARATNDAVRDWDLLSRAVWWSEGVERLFGFRRDELESDVASWMERIHPEDRSRIESGVRAAIDSAEQAWTARYRFRRGDGSYADVQDRGQFIRDLNGDAVRMLAGMTDITGQLVLEERSRQSLRLEALGQLTGGVAHDFNNLLTVILGNAELLVEHLEPAGLPHELAQMIVDATNSATTLTSRLLAFARKQALDPVAVDCNRLVAELVPLLQRTLGEHIEIDAKLAADAWCALVDPAQLENAILNLCVNSRDAMPGGGRLLIRTENVFLDEDDTSHQVDVLPGDYVLLSVTDTGCGVSAEIIGRVFEPFFTTKEKGRGTGLGLAMVYGFVQQSGGHTAIHSERGEGTVVKMYLPRSLDQPRDDGLPADVVNPMGGDETILLVEDDEQIRHLASGHLRALGYRVLQARNGVEGLRLLEQHAAVDLLFTDVVMPGGLSGRTLADAAVVLRPALKISFTSGYSQDAIVHHGRLDRGVSLLQKPYRRRDLALHVRSVLDGS